MLVDNIAIGHKTAHDLIGRNNIVIGDGIQVPSPDTSNYVNICGYERKDVPTKYIKRLQKALSQVLSHKK